MATRLYISTTEGPPVVPAAVSSLWSGLVADVRIDALLSTVIPASRTAFDSTDALASAAENGTRSVLLGQHVTAALKPGQVISSLTVAAQLLGINSGYSDLYLSLGVRVVSGDGATIRKTLQVVKRDGMALPRPLGQSNRTFSEAATFSSYTTVAGDRLVVEVGLGGDWSYPTTAGLAFGSTTGADLPVDEFTSTEGRPWIELSQTLEFEVEVSASAWSTAWTFNAVDLIVGGSTDAEAWTTTWTWNDVALTVNSGSGSAELPGLSAAGGFMMLDEEDLI